MPEVDVKTITHQHLLRSMDALIDQQEAVDRVVAGLLRPMIDQDLSVVFYDLTTIRTEGLSAQENDVREFGMSKELVDDRICLHAFLATRTGGFRAARRDRASAGKPA